ncbi:hypothetical protein NDU88_002242 [Pleurodeles waltl]|uniref:Uncharacterized protein n=1 Tax=Pleurodeles waltl TaxID=8319 RepID=A0AAV7VD92_PLEWA|nr:hypothetical protein NDU88_002242 [Pleurodeles waltl]
MDWAATEKGEVTREEEKGREGSEGADCNKDRRVTRHSVSSVYSGPWDLTIGDEVGLPPMVVSPPTETPDQTAQPRAEKRRSTSTP